MLTAVIATTGFLLIGSSAVSVYKAAEHNHAASEVVVTATISERLFDAMLSGRLERGSILGGLGTDTSVDTALTARIAETRRDSEAAYAQATALLAEVSNARAIAILVRLRNAHAKMEPLRQSLDQQLIRPKLDRDITILVNTMPECVVVVSRDGSIIQINPAGLTMLGTTLAADVEGYPAQNFIVPAHREAWLKCHRRVCDGEEISWETEVVRHGSPSRKIEVHAVPLSPPDGRPPVFLAIARDVTERKRMEQQETLLTREVDHRAKNVLTVVLAALRLTPRSNADTYASAVEGRVMALARSHTLLSQDRWAGANLRTLIEGEMAPFLSRIEGTQPVPATKLLIEGPSIQLPAHVVQPLGMVIHELATNAIKHGALSVASGQVAIRWCLNKEERLALHWTEYAGPKIEYAPTGRGFGSRMIKSSVHLQLRGTLQLDWLRDGLNAQIELPMIQAGRQA